MALLLPAGLAAANRGISLVSLLYLTILFFVFADSTVACGEPEPQTPRQPDRAPIKLHATACRLPVARPQLWIWLKHRLHLLLLHTLSQCRTPQAGQIAQQKPQVGGTYSAVAVQIQA